MVVPNGNLTELVSSVSVENLEMWGYQPTPHQSTNPREQSIFTEPTRLSLTMKKRR